MFAYTFVKITDFNFYQENPTYKLVKLNLGIVKENKLHLFNNTFVIYYKLGFGAVTSIVLVFPTRKIQVSKRESKKVQEIPN